LSRSNREIGARNPALLAQRPQRLRGALLTPGAALPARDVIRHQGIRQHPERHRVIARRQTAHGSGLGRYRWVIERTFAWLHNFKRLLVCYERRADIHHALLALGCCLVCFRRLRNSI
jgi:transposase